MLEVLLFGNGIGLPEEVVEGIAAGVDFRDHLVDVVAEFFDILLLNGRDEDARDLAAVDPLVFDLVEGEILLGLGLQ